MKVQLFSAEENILLHVAASAEDAVVCPLGRTCGLLSVHGADLKCDKGISWMPWHIEAMKDVTLCDKLRGAGSKL